MASIIRSPQISAEKRSLKSRRHAAEQPSVAPLAAAPAASEVPAAAPAAPPQINIEKLVEQARESVLAQFKAEAETAREYGRQRGLEEGRAAGAEEMRRLFDAELGQVRALADKLQAALHSSLRGTEDIAVGIAFEAVCKMMGAKAATPDGIRALVNEAIAHAAATGSVTVRLHPEDLEVLRKAGNLEAALPSGVSVTWLADRTVELGGCLIDAGGAKLDARLETQLELLRATLLKARR